MAHLYRTAVLVRRKQPYADWADGLREENEDSFPAELLNARVVYLGPSSDVEEALDDLLDEIWAPIFEEELAGWYTDESRWPQPLTRELFDAWFDCELAESVIDLVPDDPLTEAEMDAIDVEDASRHCSWCGVEVDEGRIVPFGLGGSADPDDGSERGERVLVVRVGEKRFATGVITAGDSEAAAAGVDVVFRACSRPCEKRLQKDVATALRALMAESQQR
jgi:hypothetical protein